MTRMERRQVWWVGGAALLAVIIVVAMLLLRSDDPGPIQGDVLIVGDSVTFMSIDPITEKLGADDLEIVAIPGERSTDLLPRLQEAIERRGGPGSDALEKAAFLVGYNDVMREEVDQNVLAEMVEQSSHFDCAVWMALPGRFGEALDDLIRAEVDRFDSVHFHTGWAEAVDADGSLLQDDAVHPSEAGTVALAEAYRDAFDESCGDGLPI